MKQVPEPLSFKKLRLVLIMDRKVKAGS